MSQAPRNGISFNPNEAVKMSAEIAATHKRIAPIYRVLTRHRALIE
jgi:hypothetical protein